MKGYRITSLVNGNNNVDDILIMDGDLEVGINVTKEVRTKYPT